MAIGKILDLAGFGPSDLGDKIYANNFDLKKSKKCKKCFQKKPTTGTVPGYGTGTSGIVRVLLDD
jgi:hypothetical protein